MITIGFAIVYLIVFSSLDGYVQSKTATANAEVNKRMIFAVCRRFNNNERLDVKRDFRLQLVTKNLQTKAVLEQAYREKQKLLANTCTQAMARAEADVKH